MWHPVNIALEHAQLGDILSVQEVLLGRWTLTIAQFPAWRTICIADIWPFSLVEMIAGRSKLTVVLEIDLTHNLSDRILLNSAMLIEAIDTKLQSGFITY